MKRNIDFYYEGRCLISARKGKGIILIRADNFDDALKEYQKCIERYPDIKPFPNGQQPLVVECEWWFGPLREEFFPAETIADMKKYGNAVL